MSRGHNFKADCPPNSNVEHFYFFFTFRLKSLLFLYFSIEISTFFTFLLKSLLSLYFSIEISSLLKSLLPLYFSIETSTFFFTFFFKSLLSLFFFIEISTFSLLFYWNLYFLFAFLLKFLFVFCTFLLKPLLSLYFSNLQLTTRRLAICNCIPLFHCNTNRYPAPPCTHRYKASGNLQLHSPITPQHQSLLSATLHPPLSGF